LFVSHDRYFIRALARKIIELENGNLSCFQGTYDDYTAFKATLPSNTPNPAPTVCEKPQPKTTGYRTKEERAQDAKRRERTSAVEKRISALEEEESIINDQISTPEVSTNFALLEEKCKRLEEIKLLLDDLYAEYETLI
jgi:ATP-binding cassette subfamily F protein 3